MGMVDTRGLHLTTAQKEIFLAESRGGTLYNAFKWVVDSKWSGASAEDTLETSIDEDAALVGRV